ncbi:MAG: hypothetical protein GXP49_01070 [Deltaproteobacteria bacterium]|nr:hypothetical protein [Deltaproteobacteria bacterium]
MWIRNDARGEWIDNVKGVFTTQDEAVEIKVGQADFGGRLYRGEEAYGDSTAHGGGPNYSVSFHVGDVEPGHIIDFELELFWDGGGRTKTRFQVEVKATGAHLALDRTIVIKDDNDDETINTGEDVSLQVWVKNDGTGDANGVTGDVSTTSDAVEQMIFTHADFGVISAGDTVEGACDHPGENECTASFTFRFKVKENTPAGTKIPFQLDLADDQGNQWGIPFEKTVEKHKGDLRFERAVVYKDDNDDELISQNETIQLNLAVKNHGTSRADSVTAVLSTQDQDVQKITKPNADFHTLGSNDIEYGDNTDPGGTASYSFEFVVADGVGTGDTLDFLLTMHDEHMNEWTDTFSLEAADHPGNPIMDRTECYQTDGCSMTGHIPRNTSSVKIRVWLTNSCTNPCRLDGLRGTLTSSSSHVNIHARQADWPTMAGGDTEYGRCYHVDPSCTTSGFSFILNVFDTASSGESIPFDLELMDETRNKWTIRFYLVVD